MSIDSYSRMWGADSDKYVLVKVGDRYQLASSRDYGLIIVDAKEADYQEVVRRMLNAGVTTISEDEWHVRFDNSCKELAQRGDSGL